MYMYISLVPRVWGRNYMYMSSSTMNWGQYDLEYNVRMCVVCVRVCVVCVRVCVVCVRVCTCVKMTSLPNH